MCLAIPAKIESLNGDMAHCRVGQSETFIDVSMMIMETDYEIGDYIIVHAGFGLRVIDHDAAMETLNILRQIAELNVNDRGGACDIEPPSGRSE